VTGDPIGKTLVPYAGFRVTGRRCCGKDPCGRPLTKLEYRWRVIGGFLGWNRWRSAIDPHCQSPALIEYSRTLYSMDGNRGLFLETEGQVFTPLTQNLGLFAWVTGSWLDISGPGRILATIVQGNTSTAADPFTDIFGGRAGSGRIDDAHFRRSYYGIGIGVGWSL
jgi:hypothetical protein